MGKKKRSGQGQQQRRGKTINLFEFNSEVTVGANRDVAALPSAPKAAEDWEAEGGRPEYNSRGYKERRVDAYGDADRRGFGADDDFESRDWTRRGPVDGGDDDANGFGRGGERDWGGRRSGPLDDGGGTEADFGMVRRGPLDADDGPGARGDVDFGNARRGPIEAEFGAPGGREVDFATRKGPIEADFGNSSAQGGVDFGVRKGPIDAVGTVDFAVRKGPVDAEFTSNTTGRQVDFATRKGPIEAELGNNANGNIERDFGGARKGPLEPMARDVDFGTMRNGNRNGNRNGAVEAANMRSNHSERKVDFGARRKGPLDADNNNNNSERDFGNMRRGSGGAWRRSAGRNGNTEVAKGMERLAVKDNAEDGSRDWGSERLNSTTSSAQVDTKKSSQSVEWTTVRTRAQEKS